VQEHKLACRASCDVTGGSVAVQVGNNSRLVQVVMMSQRAELLIGQEQVLYRRAACNVTGDSGVVEIVMDSWLVLLLLKSLVA